MKNASLYIDLAFCPRVPAADDLRLSGGAVVGNLSRVFLLVRRLALCHLFLLQILHRSAAVPQRQAAHVPPLTAIAVSLLVTFLFSSYEISSPFLPCPAAAGGDSRSELGRAAESAGHLAALHHRRDLLLRRRHADRSLPPAAGPRGGGVRTKQGRTGALQGADQSGIFCSTRSTRALRIAHHPFRQDREATLERFINLTKYIGQQRQSRFHTARRGGGVHRPVYRLANLAAERIRRGPLRPHGRARRNVSAAHAADYVRGKCVQVRHFVQRTLLRPYPAPPAGLHAPFRSGKLRFRAGVAKPRNAWARQLPQTPRAALSRPAPAGDRHGCRRSVFASGSKFNPPPYDPLYRHRRRTHRP